MYAWQVEGVEQHPYRAVGVALEVIPRTLAQNCGANVIRTLTKLRAKHADSTDCTFGIDGNSGKIVDMKELGVWEPYAVKVLQLLLRFQRLKQSQLTRCQTADVVLMATLVILLVWWCSLHTDGQRTLRLSCNICCFFEYLSKFLSSGHLISVHIMLASVNWQFC